jgi:hypothetical protein
MIRALALVLAAFALAGCEDPQLEADQYCEMVKLYQTSGGEYGWPDYKQNYEENCNG